MANKSHWIIGLLRNWYVIVSLVIVGAGAAIRWQSNLMPDNVSIPAPAMPSPNAWNYVQAAEVHAKVGWPESALYGIPRAAIIAGGRRGVHPPVSRPVLNAAALPSIVIENKDTIDLLRQGLRYRYESPRALVTGDPYPHHVQDRMMAWLLTSEGEVKAAKEDWGGAMDSYLDAIDLGSDLPHGSTTVGLFDGVTSEQTARNHAYPAVDHLTAPQSIADARRLAAIDAAQEPFSQTMQDIELSEDESMLRYFDEPDRRGILSGYTAHGTIMLILTQLPLAFLSPRGAYNNANQCFSAWIERTRLPWPAQRSLSPPAQPVLVFRDLDAPGIYDAESKQLGTIALNRILETQIALHAYRLDHGQYPGSLDALVPKYLPAVPQDPFSNANLLRYKLVGNRYLLYSIGPDAVDDGGRPIDDPKAPQDGLWDYRDRGDLVAGVNF